MSGTLALLRTDNDIPVLVAQCQLAGGISASSGLKCFGNYDGDLNPITCP